MTDKRRKDTSDAEAAPPKTDIALIVGATADGKGAHVLRAREGKLEVGAVLPLREGAPIHGEVVQLKPRADAPRLCDVEVLVEQPSAAAPSDVATPTLPPQPAASARHKGPARVASDAYRENWDAIWSTRRRKPELVN